jgi:23S rRNA (adenine2503-C2)-methyltransferase
LRATSERASLRGAVPDPDLAIPSDPALRTVAHAIELECVERSQWNERFVVRLADGAKVECVLYRADTLCISSQVGCAVRCPFCASGQGGLARGLELGELIGQVEAIRARGAVLARVTVSGVGEPLHNHRAVTSFREWCSRERLGMSLTSSGGPLVRLKEWLHAPHNGLTLSVHAGTEPVRARLVPNGPALDPLFAMLSDELPRMTQRRRKKTALAYLLVEGVNDSAAELGAFSARAQPLGLRVHLYAYNPVVGLGFARVGRDRYEAAYQQLTAAGLRVMMSSQARIEANGGCGTLVALRTT